MFAFRNMRESGAKIKIRFYDYTRHAHVLLHGMHAKIMKMLNLLHPHYRC